MPSSDMFCTASFTSEISTSSLGKKFVSSRPTIMEMSLSLVISEAEAVPTNIPSRSTVTSSEISKTSSILWVMYITATPLLRTSLIIRKRWATSFSVMAEVGSSITMSLEL